MAWHGVIQRHTWRVKLENVGIVGMPVISLGIIFIERRTSLRRLCDIPSYVQKNTSYGRV